ncbi:MAG: hypothetical protein GXP25_09610 [Planctomycetes bacterium]|nr:hypothetical protein [Planctomycetota bacterium]
MRSKVRMILPLALALALAMGYGDAWAKSKKKKRKPPKDIPTLMTTRGDLLVQEEFGGDAIPEQWKALIGKWEIEDGALKGTEQAADDHGAVSRIEIDCTDVIVQFSFMLKGARGTSLSFNNKDGHVCRASFNPGGFSVSKDRPRKDSEEKGERIDTVKFEFKEGRWYDVCVEILEKGMVASIGGDKKMMFVAFGENDGVGKPKTNFGFTVGGVDQSVYFDNVRVWKSKPNKKWKKTKKKLEKIRMMMQKKGLR